MTTIAEAMLALLIIGFIIGFILAFSMGANDAANSFGTSYGSKVVTFFQICILASIFTTLGAVLLGSRVANTVTKGIANLDRFTGSAYEVMYGYLSALVGASGWLLIATLLKLPVSGTHSIVGAIVGFTLVARGVDGIKWITLVKIAGSWFTSPILSGAIASALFIAVKYLVLLKDNPLDAGCKLLPVLYGLTFTVIFFMIIDESRGFFGHGYDVLPIWAALLIAIGLGLLCWLVFFIFFMPILKNTILKRKSKQEAQQLDSSGFRLKPTKTVLSRKKRLQNWFHTSSMLIRENLSLKTLRGHGATSTPPASPKAPIAEEEPDFKRNSTETPEESYSNGNIYTIPVTSPEPDMGSSDVSQFTEVTESESENIPKEDRVMDLSEIRHLFSFIQVVTATFASFSHGANDVSNAVGPVVGMFQIYRDHSIAQDGKTEWWILLYGGFGISAGLALLGKKVMQTVGDELTTIHPTTGFCMELGASLTVLLASHLGIPVSTTHCLVGAVVCVGLVRSRRDIDWKIVRNIAISWFVTVPAAALISAGCMAAVRAIFQAANTFQYWDYWYPSPNITDTTTIAVNTTSTF